MCSSCTNTERQYCSVQVSGYKILPPVVYSMVVNEIGCAPVGQILSVSTAVFRSVATRSCLQSCTAWLSMRLDVLQLHQYRASVLQCSGQWLQDPASSRVQHGCQ